MRCLLLDSGVGIDNPVATVRVAVRLTSMSDEEKKLEHARRLKLINTLADRLTSGVPLGEEERLEIINTLRREKASLVGSQDGLEKPAPIESMEPNAPETKFLVMMMNLLIGYYVNTVAANMPDVAKQYSVARILDVVLKQYIEGLWRIHKDVESGTAYWETYVDGKYTQVRTLPVVVLPK